MGGRVMTETQEARNTTQLVKPRLPPGWSGQQFDKWRAEVEKWNENNRATDEDKFVNLVESLKKNDAVKDFVSKSLLDKIGETRTVKKILEILAEKYSKTTCEQIKNTMKKIFNQKMNEKVDAHRLFWSIFLPIFPKFSLLSLCLLLYPTKIWTRSLSQRHFSLDFLLSLQIYPPC